MIRSAAVSREGRTVFDSSAGEAPVGMGWDRVGWFGGCLSISSLVFLMFLMLYYTLPTLLLLTAIRGWRWRRRWAGTTTMYDVRAMYL